MTDAMSLQDILHDAHAYIYLLQTDQTERLRLWDITSDSIIMDIPQHTSINDTITGYIPTLSGDGIFEVHGKITSDLLTDQMENTVRVITPPHQIKKVNRRIFPRYCFTPPLDAEIGLASQPCHLIGKIVNLSASGLRIETPESLHANQMHHIAFEIDYNNHLHTFDINSRIVYEIPLSNGFAYGISFDTHLKERTSVYDEVNINDTDTTIGLLDIVNKLIITQRVTK